MQITSASILNVQLVTPAVGAPTSGPLARALRQAKRELGQLLEVERDSPTMRLKIAEARAVLAELEAQIPQAPTPDIMIVKHSIDVVPASPVASKPAPALPPRPKVLPSVSAPRPRNSPLQKMREIQRLETIEE